jgi:hypothetical protein
MIRVPQQHWWEICEAIYDDSAGPIDPPQIFADVIDADWVELHFFTPADETLFCLRWIN